MCGDWSTDTHFWTLIKDRFSLTEFIKFITVMCISSESHRCAQTSKINDLLFFFLTQDEHNGGHNCSSEMSHCRIDFRSARIQNKIIV